MLACRHLCHDTVLNCDGGGDEDQGFSMTVRHRHGRIAVMCEDFSTCTSDYHATSGDDNGSRTPVSISSSPHNPCTRNRDRRAGDVGRRMVSPIRRIAARRHDDYRCRRRMCRCERLMPGNELQAEGSVRTSDDKTRARLQNGCCGCERSLRSYEAAPRHVVDVQVWLVVVDTARVAIRAVEAAVAGVHAAIERHTRSVTERTNPHLESDILCIEAGRDEQHGPNRYDYRIKLHHLFLLRGLPEPGRAYGAGVFERPLWSNAIIPADFVEAPGKNLQKMSARLHGKIRPESNH